MRNSLAKLAKSLFRMGGLEVRNRRFLYVDPLEDLANILKDVPEPVILDVGANRGDTVADYRRVFERSWVHAFEPTPEMSSNLIRRFCNDPRVKVVAQAVSDKVGTTTFHLMSNSVMNSVLPYRDSAGSYYGVTQKERIDVRTTTIAKYCEAAGIERVQLLKLDIQGAEKLALAGAQAMLAASAIDAIYFEIQFFPLYSGQTCFGDLEAMLRLAGYRLFGFYEMNRERNGSLDFCNALYLSAETYARLNPHYLY